MTCACRTSEVTLCSSVVTPRTHGGAQRSDPPTGGQTLGPVWALWLEVTTAAVPQSSAASPAALGFAVSGGGATGVAQARATAAWSCGYTPRRSGIGWVRQTRSRHAAYPGRVACAPDRSEQRGLFAPRGMSPLSPAQRKLTRLARLLLRQRRSLARLCPIQDLSHRPAGADHAAPERTRRAAPTARFGRRPVRWCSRPKACTRAGTAVTAQFRVTGDHGGHPSVRTGADIGPGWAGGVVTTRTGPAAGTGADIGTHPAAGAVSTLRSSAVPRKTTGPIDATRAANARLDTPLVDPTQRLDYRPRMNNYWPWWAGAVGLAAVTINYTISTDRSLGVSAAWDRVLHWRSERRLEQLEAQFTGDRALAEVLVAATAEHFGTGPGAPIPPDTGGDAQTLSQDGGSTAGDKAAPVAGLRPAPLVTQAALLLSIFLGGWVAAVTAGRFELRFDMGNGYRELVTANPTAMICVLFVGGVLVGFGTRLAGGCSSGHGLSGCGRLRPVSILATAVFFGSAVVVSFLLWKVI